MDLWQEIRSAYEKFHREYPKGNITREAYIKENKDYVLNDALFRVFDEDSSGTLNFFEWFQASNVKNMSTIEEKLNWIFTAFDADGGGSIDPEEITEIVKWMFRWSLEWGIHAVNNVAFYAKVRWYWGRPRPPGVMRHRCQVNW